MLSRSCIDVLSKQMLCLRPFVALGSQSTSWYATKSVSYPSPPKRNKSAWTLFVTENLTSVKKEYPHLGQTELFQKVSEKWRKLDQGTLDKYQKAALKEKEQYVKNLETYNASLTPEMKSAIAKSKETDAKIKHKKQLLSLGMPKRPPNAYILFSMDYLKNSNSTALIKESPKISSAWSSLSHSEKSKWNELAAEREKEYKKKLGIWESEMVSKGLLEVVPPKSKSKSKSK